MAVRRAYDKRFPPAVCAEDSAPVLPFNQGGSPDNVLTMPLAPLIVLIDGDCPICHSTAIWFARRDPAARMIFAANQGVVARIAGEPAGGDTRTLVVWDGSRRLVRSGAALAMLRSLGGGWALAARGLAWIPVGWRDAFYDFIARHRRRLPGQAAACTLLSPRHLAE